MEHQSLKPPLTIGYSYTDAALAAITDDREDVTEDINTFFSYRVYLHLLFYPRSTYLVTLVGMVIQQEVVSICNNNNVWFCLRDEWNRKLEQCPNFPAVQIFDPIDEPGITTDNLIESVQKQAAALDLGPQVPTNQNRDNPDILPESTG